MKPINQGLFGLLPQLATACHKNIALYLDGFPSLPQVWHAANFASAFSSDLCQFSGKQKSCHAFGSPQLRCGKVREQSKQPLDFADQSMVLMS